MEGRVQRRLGPRPKPGNGWIKKVDPDMLPNGSYTLMLAGSKASVWPVQTTSSILTPRSDWSRKRISWLPPAKLSRTFHVERPQVEGFAVKFKKRRRLMGGYRRGRLAGGGQLDGDHPKGFQGCWWVVRSMASFFSGTTIRVCLEGLSYDSQLFIQCWWWRCISSSSASMQQGSQ